MRKIKKIISFGGLLFAIVIFSGIANAQVDANYFGRSPNIIVSLIKQEPDPVEPGKQVEVTFKIDNNGTSADNFIFEILPEYPFSLLPQQSPSSKIGTLGTSQYGRYSVTVKYKLKVAQDASDGDYQVKVRYKSDNLDSWAKLDNFKIKVQTHDAILGVEKFLTTPVVTAPGEKTKLRIELKNYATSLLKDIKLSLSLDKTSDDLRPFSPIGATNEKVISYIEPQAVFAVEFELLVDSDASAKAYKIPLSIGYSDALNKNYSKTNLVTIVVGNVPDVGVSLERTDIYTSDNTGNVVLRIVNKGTAGIKFLNAKLLQNENVKVIGADEFYIGKLDSDDFSTAEFKLYLKGKDSVKIPVQITYKDTNNNNYKESREVELKLYSEDEAKKLGLSKSSTLLWIVLGAAVLLAGYYIYRRMRKRKS